MLVCWRIGGKNLTMAAIFLMKMVLFGATFGGEGFAKFRTGEVVANIFFASQ